MLIKSSVKYVEKVCAGALATCYVLEGDYRKQTKTFEWQDGKREKLEEYDGSLGSRTS